jgi:hypothetical protein
MSQFNFLPNFPTPLNTNSQTTKDWYFFWAGLYQGLAPANVEGITVGTSPYSYSAIVKGSVIVQGGTVSLIEFTRDGINWYDVGATAGMFYLNAADQLRTTYTGVPAITFIPT